MTATTGPAATGPAATRPATTGPAVPRPGAPRPGATRRASGRRPRLLVVGAGVTGLAAAYEAGRGGAEVTVVDAARRPGGHVLTTSFAGLPLDAGPDAFLARVPHATELCRELGLGDELVAPAVRTAYLWAGNDLRPFPERLVLGVPTDLQALARTGVVSPAGIARAAEDLHRPADGPPPGVDESVGDLIRRRLGPEVLEALVDPLLSGIFAGDTDRLSLRAGAPQLALAADAGASIIAGARTLLPARAPATARPANQPAHGHPGPADEPVFLTLVGGLGRLVEALVGRLDPGRLRLGRAVAALRPRPGGGFTARLGSDRGGDGLEADGVVLTCPAPVTAALVRPLAPRAAGLLGAIEYASVVLVSFAFDAADVPRPLDGSGFLVPRPAGLLMTACSWSSTKFAHLGGDGRVRLRVSAGRHGDDRIADLDDRALVDALRADLRTTMGITRAPVEVRVTRWPASLPQYTVGHLERLAEVEAELSALPGVVATGAAFRGVGLPACVAQGRAAARTVLSRLG